MPIDGTLGFVLNLADRPADAITVLRRALDLEPHAMIYFFLGNALADVGEFGPSN